MHEAAASKRPFDYVLVDGRRRDECLAEVLRGGSGILSEQYGMLALDNSERPYVAAVPPQWPCVSFREGTTLTHEAAHETTLWMACPHTLEPECASARRQIQHAMAMLPPELVGGRCGSAGPRGP